MLHTVFASIADGTSAAAEDTIAASGYTGGESEVQERSQIGGLPKLIGHGCITTDVAVLNALVGAPYYRIGLNTWPQAHYITRAMHAYGVPNAGGSPIVTSTDQLVDWLPQGIPLDRDADWDVRTFTTTASKSATVALYQSYGTPVPWMGAPTVWRKVTHTSDGTANTWTDGATITDLDPRLKYRVSALGGSAEDKAVQAVRLTSSSNNTSVGALCNQVNAVTNQTAPRITVFPHDSIIVSGVETIQTSVLVDEASRPTIFVGFTPVGGASSASPGAGAGPNIGGLIGGLVGGGMGGFLGR